MVAIIQQSKSGVPMQSGSKVKGDHWNSPYEDDNRSFQFRTLHLQKNNCIMTSTSNVEILNDKIHPDGMLTGTYRTPFVSNQIVFQFHTYDDYKLLCFGLLGLLDPLITGVVKLNSDGTRDTTFNTGGEGCSRGTPSDGFVLSNGKIMVYGAGSVENPVTYNGVLVPSHLFRINSDGSLDETYSVDFNICAGSGIRISKCFRFSDDSALYFVKGFASRSSVTYPYIFKTLPNGNLDVSYSANCSKFTGGYLHDAAIQSDGKVVIVCDTAAMFNGYSVNGIFRLNTDGTRDTSFHSSTGFVGTPYTVKLDDQERIIVGGAFSSYRSVAAKCLTRILSNGTKDSTFDTEEGFEVDTGISTVRALVLPYKKMIFCCGNFNSYKGISRNGLACVNNDASLLL